MSTKNVTGSVVQIEVQGLDVLCKMVQELTSKIEKLELMIQNQNTSSKMLNRAEVADLLGITWQQVATLSFENEQQKTHKKILPCKKVGKNFLYDRKKVLEAKSTLKI